MPLPTVFGSARNIALIVLTKEEYLDADTPSASVEEKRLTFLKSLARTMAELRMLNFAQIGMPVFDYRKSEHSVRIDAAWCWHSSTLFMEPTYFGPFQSSKQFFMGASDNICNPVETIDNFSADSKLKLGALRERKILEIILASSPFTSSTESSDVQKLFVLSHDDLDLQNVFTGKYGNVTGIIDWDGVTRLLAVFATPLYPSFFVATSSLVSLSIDPHTRPGR